MGRIPLTRGQFLMPFIDIHDEIGAPTASLLQKFRLPTSFEDKANHYIPLLPALRFAEAAQREQGIPDLGFRASQRLHYVHLSKKLRAAIGSSPTLLIALQRACKWAPLEDTILNLWLEYHNDHVRVCSNLLGSSGIAHLEHSQWLQNVFIIHIVRQFTGRSWCPATIAFEAHYAPGPKTRSFWPDTRFLAGQKASWIDVAISDLSLPNSAGELPGDPSDDEGEPTLAGMISTLKLLLPTYLDEGAPSIVEVAQMASVSVRSLQRKLSAAGLTYSGMLETARFENATRLLSDTDDKIIDIAFSSGYTDPAHFTRAFQRMSGTTPRQFRVQQRAR